MADWPSCPVCRQEVPYSSCQQEPDELVEALVLAAHLKFTCSGPELTTAELLAEAARLGIPLSMLPEAIASTAMARDGEGTYSLPEAADLGMAELVDGPDFADPVYADEEEAG